jgi:hypothetical protein
MSGTRVLYHQGALDWGYKFLADILRRDPAFTITPVLTLGPAQDGRGEPGGPGKSLPVDRAGYEDYDIVVLSNTTANQLSDAQQEALTAWVREGGVLVFLMPDDSSTRGFAGSELEKMLPVVFASDDAGDRRRAPMRPSLRALGGGRFDLEAAALAEFAWEPAAAQIFGRGEIASPKFINFARVLRAKPGADVLARHPTAPSPANGDPGRAILLAVQRYGQGRSAVLTSDALWRWKLNQPSTERNVEKFWQNLFAWLGRERNNGLHFDRPPLTAAQGQGLSLRLAGAGASAARLTARSGDRNATLTSTETEANAAVFRWTPPAAGEWELTARDAAGGEIHHWLLVSGSVATGERSGAPPDETVLAKLAIRTGGAVLREGDTPPWQGGRSAVELPPLPEVVHPVWHQPWLLWTLLGTYSLELLLRRRWRLL